MYGLSIPTNAPKPHALYSQTQLWSKTLNSDQILEKVSSIFQEILDDDTLAIERPTTADDIDDWDSLTHIQLVVAIEKSFKIRFKGEEIQGYGNVGEMCDAIVAKLNAI